MGMGDSMREAAQIQADAANKASATQMEMFQENKALLNPFVQMGQQGGNMLMSQLPNLTAPINLDQQWLENTPGYQFQLGQGLETIQNSFAAKGLGSSGAAMKGAADYASGLASSNYETQFNNALAGRAQTYNMLLGTTQMGANAAAGTAQLGAQTATNIGQNQIAAGNAMAGYYMQQANAQNQLFGSLLGLGGSLIGTIL